MGDAPWGLASLFLIVTDTCNLRCAYCYQGERSGRWMAWRTVEEAVARLWASPKRAVRLLLTGGEPLLDFAFVQRLVAFVRSTQPSRRSVSIDVLTNGTRLGEDQVRYFARHHIGVQISLDGLEPAQRLRGGGTFQHLDALVRSMRHRHRAWFERRATAAMTLVPETIPYLADSVDYLLGQQFAGIGISPAMGPVPGWHPGLLSALDSQFARVFRSSLQLYRRTGLVPVECFRKTPAARPRRSAPLCGIATGRMAVVDIDGQVYGCPPVVGSALTHPSGLVRVASNAMRIGDVTDPRIADRLPGYRSALLATGLFGRRDAKYSSYGACRDCHQVRHCEVCPLSIALEPGASDPSRVPDFACAYNQVSLTYRARFPVQRSNQHYPRYDHGTTHRSR